MSLALSPSPHIHSGADTRRVMLDVLIALTPSVIAAAALFSLRALLLVLVTTVAACGAEALFCIVTKRKQTVSDLSAAVTGVILALNLPYTLPLWQAAVGGVFATLVVKMLFGGIGKNFANPAATARIVLILSFAEMSAHTFTRFQALDGVTSATPLTEIANGTPLSELPSLLDLFLGNLGGAMGETCILAILIGAVYLLCRRVITLHAPLAFIGASYLLTLALTGDLYLSLYLILSGGILFAAVFMVTDYTTTPLSKAGQVIFGVGCGIITVIIRHFGSLPEGVSYAILLMNILTPYIDKLSLLLRRPFGAIRKRGTAK